jgi:hypothetical protein
MACSHSGHTVHIFFKTLSGTLSLCQSLTNAALLLSRFLKLGFSRLVEVPNVQIVIKLSSSLV